MLKHFIVTLFLSAPVSVIPLLDNTARLDLLDYYEAKMPAKVQNRFGGMTELTHLSDTLITLQMTEATALEMRLLPDSTIELRKHLELPEGRTTHTSVYTRDWVRVE